MPSQLTDNAQSWIIALSVEPKKFFFPNSFSYGVLANRGSTGSGKVSGQVPEEGCGMFQGGSGPDQGGSGSGAGRFRVGFGGVQARTCWPSRL